MRTPAETLLLLDEEAEFYRLRQVEAETALLDERAKRANDDDVDIERIRVNLNKQAEARAGQIYCSKSADAVQKAVDLTPGLINLEGQWRSGRFMRKLILSHFLDAPENLSKAASLLTMMGTAT